MHWETPSSFPGSDKDRANQVLFSFKITSSPLEQMFTLRHTQYAFLHSPKCHTRFTSPHRPAHPSSLEAHIGQHGKAGSLDVISRFLRHPCILSVSFFEHLHQPERGVGTRGGGLSAQSSTSSDTCTCGLKPSVVCSVWPGWGLQFARQETHLLPFKKCLKGSV